MKINKRRPAFEYGLVGDTKHIFSDIFNATPVAIILLAWPTKKVLRVNKAAFGLFRVKTLPSFLQRYGSLFEKISEDSFGNRDSFDTEIKLKTTKGSLIYLTLKARKFEKSKIVLTLEDITQYKNKERKLIKLAELDGLTGLLNHKTLMFRFTEELTRAKKYHLPLSCLLFDIDDFKTINDKFGHLQGDQCLKKVAQTLKSSMRETDIIGRFGGDEFLIIMPETPTSEAWIPARRIHSCFLENPVTFKFEKVKISPTFSIGISGFPLNAMETVKAIIYHADKGLYESKLKGGNQIVLLNS